MSKPSKGTVTIEVNNHTLVITIIRDRRFFSCEFPEIAEQFDGTADPTQAIEEFERRAMAPPPPAPVRQPSLFDTVEESVADFNGPAYDPALDRSRLQAQMRRVYDLMADGVWRTLREIAAATGDPESSVSAQLRHLRKPRFGGHGVSRRRRGAARAGLWEYRLEVKAADAA